MLHTSGNEAEIGEAVELRKDVQQPAWFRHRQGSSTASVPSLRMMKQLVLESDVSPATGNRVRGTPLAAGWQGSQSCGCA